MMGVTESFARLPRARPVVFYSRNSRPIEGSPALPCDLGSQNTRMISRNGRERDGW
jgi:hypothetical protein